MKTVIYITKNKIWAGGVAFDWDGVSMGDVFERIKKELKETAVRVILGNDVSFVTAVKAGDTFLNRENVLKLVKTWMPFAIDNDCFDWKQLTLAHDEIWIQVVAMEKELLMSLSAAVRKSGIKVDLITAIGILMAEKTVGREAPVIIRWEGKENLSVLAINGLADIVLSDTNQEDLMVYANQRWSLAVNPEVLTLHENEFDLSEVAYSLKVKGEDRAILNLPILKGIEEPEIDQETKKNTEMIKNENEMTEKPKSKLWIYLLALVIVAIISTVVMFRAGLFDAIISGFIKPTPTPTPAPTVVITPEPTKPDLSIFQVQVLNGSGVTGEAARIKEILLANGFINVDTGNAVATTEATVSFKDTVPEAVVDTVNENINDYMIGAPGSLTEDDKYDLIIVVGSAKKL